MLNRGPLTRLLGRRALWTVLGLLLLVEAIFVAESFTTIMEQTIRNGGTAWDLALLLVFKMPEVVDFALPLALMLGLYFAITGARADNELMVCATAGVPWTRIPSFAAAFGMVGLCVSLIFSGILTPLSAFALRLSLFELETKLILRQLADPGSETIIRSHRGQTIIATPSNDPGARRGNLFIHKAEPGGGWRVNQADDWSADGPDADGNYRVRMRTFRESTGSALSTESARPKEPGGLRQVLGGVSVAVNSVTMDLQSRDLVRELDRARRGNEVLIFGLAAGALRAENRLPDRTTRRFGELLARALLCPIAALLAVAAAAEAATRLGRYLALPVAVLAVLALDILGRSVLGDGAAQGGGALVLAASGFALIGLAAPLTLVIRRGEQIVTPVRGTA